MTTPAPIAAAPLLPVDPRVAATRKLLVVLAVLCVVMMILSVWWGTGQLKISPVKAIDTLLNPDGASELAQVSVDNRLSRVLMSFGVGVALATAGALLQTLYRNPLASPEITGVSQGSIVAVVCYLVFAPDAVNQPVWVLPMVGSIGGLLAGLLTWAVTRLGGKIDPLRLILTGVLLAGLLGSIVAIAIISRTALSQDLVQWTVGAIGTATWERVGILYLGVLVATPIGIVSIPYANALGLGDDIGQGVGLNVGLARGLVLLSAAVLTASAVSLVGGIGFVGLVAPHLVRRVTGSDLRRLVPAAAMAGASLVAVADFASRNFRPNDIATHFGVPEEIARVTLPTGVYLALFGAPFFIHLLRRLP
ncbi:MAG: iron ABC transporter permease [Actinomycetota bacterium]